MQLPALAGRERIKVGWWFALSGTMAISETTLKDKGSFGNDGDDQNKKGVLLGKKVLGSCCWVDPAPNWPFVCRKRSVSLF